jgi:hypothetical protein
VGRIFISLGGGLLNEIKEFIFLYNHLFDGTCPVMDLVVCLSNGADNFRNISLHICDQSNSFTKEELT